MSNEKEDVVLNLVRSELQRSIGNLNAENKMPTMGCTAKPPTEEVPYWSWTCPKCQYKQNRLKQKSLVEVPDLVCCECKAKIRCETLGKHEFDSNSGFCQNGCGLQNDGHYDSTQRRIDY